MKYSFDSRVRYSEIGEDRHLTLNGMINYFQDCSTFQSEAAGVGMDFLGAKSQAWVLSAWQIVVERYPVLCENIKVSTWAYNFRHFLGSWNFTMEDTEGNLIACANTYWTLLNMQTGRPVSIDEKQLQAYGLEEKLDMDYAPRKIKKPINGKEYPSFAVRPHHLDTNHHVNNGQYVLMAQEYLPADFAVKQMRAEYKNQAKLGDIIVPSVHEENGVYTVVLDNTAGEAYAVVELK